MSALTENFPFCYAFKGTQEKDGKQIEMIRVHILINVSAGNKITPINPGDLSGQTKVFRFELDTVSPSSGYKLFNYEFPVKETPPGEKEETIDTVEIYTIVKNSGFTRIKTMKIEVEDMDVEPGTWSTINQNVLLEAPYVCTQRMEVEDPITHINHVTGFSVQMYVKCTSKRTFTAEPNKLGGVSQNTEYKIASVNNSSGSLEYVSDVQTFDIADVHLTNGANSTNHGNRKGKTKNKNHTVTPISGIIIENM